MSYFKPISISLSPNVQKDDVRGALNLIIRPWLWKKGKTITQFEDSFKQYLGVKYAFSFNSGRSSLFAILQSLDLEKQSQVLLQAFTCNAVPNPILWAGLEPIYVDCSKEDFNINISDLKAKISPRTRVLVLQHTFGLPANMREIQAICKEHNIILIEDCAHALGAEYEGQKVGTFGDASFFSFSRDKVISSVYGGMAVTNNEQIAKRLKELQGKFGQPSLFWIFQQLLHPIFLQYVILPIYAFLDLGKIFLVASQIIHLLSKAVSMKEKRGERPDYFPKVLPNALAVMALCQFNKLEILNGRRRQIADYYYEKLRGTGVNLPQKFDERKNIFLRFSITTQNAKDILYKAWSKENILIGDWYTTVIAPDDTKLEAMHYVAGSCKNAEELCQMTLNLPTHINMKEKDLERVVNLIKMEKIRVVDVLMKLTDGQNQGKFVLQQRSLANKTFHYVCQATWAGKVEAGEDVMEAVKRECREELGEVFYDAFDFSRLTFVGIEENSVEGKDYVVYNYLGEISENLLGKAKIHPEALQDFVFIDHTTEIFPLSAGKEPAKCIVVFDDQYRVLEKIFNGDTTNKK